MNYLSSPGQQAKYGELLAKARQRVEEIRRLQAAGLICHDGDFVPSVHYPPITQYSPITEDELFAGYALPQDGLFDIYVHLPFCERRCTFCHYPVKYGKQTEEKNRYLSALEKEMDIYMRRLGVDKIKARSVLIGGGTPTFLTSEQLKRFLKFFSDRVDLTQCTQFNYDVDPGTLVGESGLERLRIMKDYGVDRLTIGVQSLSDDILKIMNRPHDAQTAIESIENSRKFGYQINIEFIFGHPGETIENWIDVIDKAAKLPVDEIQLYRLKVLAYGDLQGTIIKHRSRIPSFEETMMMKQIAIDILAEHGFHENLRRVYSKKKKHYSHYAYNQCCNLYDQIGFGQTAFSSLHDRFVLNTQHFDEYYAKIEKGELPLNRGYIRNKEQHVRWAIVLPLKNSELKKDYFEKVTGVHFDKIFRKKVERLKHFGLIEENDGIVRLTELGAFVADEVVEQFNSNEFMPFPRESYAKGPLFPYADNTIEDALGSSDGSSIGEYVKQITANNSKYSIQDMDDQQLKSLLTSTGEEQEELFRQARAIRHQYFGDEIKLRGVIEISNICQKNCDYCAMRRGNSSLKRFRLDAKTITEAARSIIDTGITTVFLQSGQDLRCDSILEEVIPAITNDLGADIILNVGERGKETYEWLAQLGTKGFIMKYETTDAALYENIAHDTLVKRTQCMKWIRDANMKIGTGNIIGLPHQSIESIISDIRMTLKFKPDFASTSPFIPNKGTPLQEIPLGDLNLTLNVIAILRIGLKDALIPAVSALEYIHPGGQLMGLNAGANVMTINFTPQLYRENYNIYTKDRFIVSLKHAINTAKMAGFKINSKVYQEAS